MRQQVSISDKALRDGQPADIPAAQIDPGDGFNGKRRRKVVLPQPLGPTIHGISWRRTSVVM
jgi:hypothetical protein